MFATSPVAAQINPPQSNPLQMVEQLALARNLMNQNQLFQANRSGGNALLSAAAAPGGLTAQGLVQNLQGVGPDAGLVAPELLGVGLQQRTSAQALAATQYQALQTQTGAVPPDMSITDPDARLADQRTRAAALIQRGVQAGVYPAEMAASYVGNGMPDLPAVVKEAAVASGSAPDVEAQFGQTALQNLGGAVQGVNVNRVQNTVSPQGAPIQTTRSPEAMGAPISVIGPSGAPEMHPSSDFIDGQGNVKPGAAPPVVGWAPGVAEARSSNLQSQQAQGNALMESYVGSAARFNLLDEMSNTLKTQDFRTGPGAAKWAGYVAEANRILGTNLSADPSNAEQVFGKMAEQFSSFQRAALGNAATDAQTAATRIASPNTAYSNEANQEVIALMKGNEKLIQTEFPAWQKYQGAAQTPATQAWAQRSGVVPGFGDFSQRFWKEMNPRYFQEPFMTPAQASTMRSAMTPAEQKAYDAAKAKALSYGFSP